MGAAACARPERAKHTATATERLTPLSMSGSPLVLALRPSNLSYELRQPYVHGFALGSRAALYAASDQCVRCSLVRRSAPRGMGSLSSCASAAAPVVAAVADATDFFELD